MERMGSTGSGTGRLGDARNNLMTLIQKHANMEDQTRRVEEMMQELADLETRELERNDRLKEQLQAIHIAHERRVAEDADREKAVQMRTLEQLLQKQTETLAKVIEGALSPLATAATAAAVSPPPPPPPPLPLYATPPPPPPPLPLAMHTSPPRDHQFEDTLRRACTAEAMVETLKKEVYDSRAEVRLLSVELQRLADARAEDDRMKASMHGQMEQLLQGGQGARLKAMLAEFVDRPRGAGAQAPLAGPGVGQLSQPTAEAQLREENRRLIAELRERDASDRFMTLRMQELAARSSVGRGYR